MRFSTRPPLYLARSCSRWPCPHDARRSGLCVFHDPKATPEEVEAAERALEPQRRRFGRRCA